MFDCSLMTMTAHFLDTVEHYPQCLDLEIGLWIENHEAVSSVALWRCLWLASKQPFNHFTKMVYKIGQLDIHLRPLKWMPDTTPRRPTAQNHIRHALKAGAWGTLRQDYPNDRSHWVSIGKVILRAAVGCVVQMRLGQTNWDMKMMIISYNKFIQEEKI